MVSAKLKALYLEQQTAVGELGLRRRQPPRDLSELISLAPEVLGAACRGFNFGKALTGSWVAGQSLVMQLLIQPRLTVDLTLKELKADRPFDIDIDIDVDVDRKHQREWRLSQQARNGVPGDINRVIGRN